MTQNITKQEMIDSIKEAKQQLPEGENLSFMKFRELADTPVHRARTLFGGWNKAKKAAGLDDIHVVTKRSDEEIIKDLKDYAEEHGEPVKLKDFAEKQEYSEGTVQRFGAFHKLAEEAGVKPFHGRTKKKHVIEAVNSYEGEREKLNEKNLVSHFEDYDDYVLYSRKFNIPEIIREEGFEYIEREEMEDIVAEELASRAGSKFLDRKELKRIAEDVAGFQPFPSSNGYGFKKLEEVMERNGYDITIPKGTGAIYIDDGRYDDEDEYRITMMEKLKNQNSNLPEDEEIEEDRLDLLIETIGMGIGFTGAFAGLAYLETYLTQKELTEHLDVSEVTVRKNAQRISEEFDIEYPDAKRRG